MTEKTLTTENIRPALDALRGELAPWPVVAKKQDRLNTAQLNAANSGITSSLVAQIIANTAAIRALESAITGTRLRALVVASLPAVGTTGILYIVPVTTYDPDTDADVVNYSNEYIWIPVEGGTASEGHYEQVGQTGIVINNGQLTITVNGTSVGTFTANQSGDTTAAITVPTNADYVDRTTDQTVAGVKTFSSTINGTSSKAIADEDGTSIKTGYVNVAGDQTVTGDKSFTGSNTFNNILPNATNTYSLGSSSYQWSSVYAQTYYYNGTEFSSKFVTTDTSQSISRQKTFNANLICTSSIYTRNDNYTSGTVPTSSMIAMNRFVDRNNLDIGYTRAVIRADGSTEAELKSINRFTNEALDPAGSAISSSLIVGISNTGSTYARFNGRLQNDINPATSGSYNCGTSTNKWKTLNGVNPGALSLPKGYTEEGADKDYVDISSVIQTLDDTIYTYTLPDNGWIVVRADMATHVQVAISAGWVFGQSIYHSTGGTLIASVPFRKGETVALKVLGSILQTARFYPMQGNV